ncbi:hypothetical protein ANCCAN_09900 [Ancylostoma caninum]|uniref:Uncharacterized protein n=1 Tax=Ancylostoma caninum TaxID=29170 RepID=A0A368GID0_ANCCA|nr:hypothetical protein ANCCAN_09900 [Ancylostoma caninum]
MPLRALQRDRGQANATSPISAPSSGAPQTFVNQQLSPWNGPESRYTIPYGRQKSTWQNQGQHLQPAQNVGDEGFVPSPASFGGYGKRKKRAAKQSIVGSRFIIGCSNRGESDDNLLALCGSCWAWRELPEDYFPRLLNELSCKENDFCLSGWGECVQQFRNVDVLRKVGGQWQSAALSVATCCDCRVRAGTEVHSLVVGDRNRIVLT